MDEKLSDKMESFSKGPMADYGYFKTLVEEARLLEEKMELLQAVSLIKKERKKGPSCVYTCPDCGAKLIGKNRAGTIIRAAIHMIKVHNRKGGIPSNELDEHITELRKEIPFPENEIDQK